MRDAGQRNGPEGPMEAWAWGARVLDKVVREWALETDIGVGAAVAGLKGTKGDPDVSG